MTDNRDCYWVDEYIDYNTEPPTVKYFCDFPEEPQFCEFKPCLKYVAIDKVDEYIKKLLEENKMLDEALTRYEEGLM